MRGRGRSIAALIATGLVWAAPALAAGSIPLDWAFGNEAGCHFFLTGEAASFEAKAVSSPDRYVEFHVFPYDGGIAVSFRDWTERRRAEEELRETQARLSALADNLPVGMVYQMLESDNFFARKFIYLSASCERLNGIPAEAALVSHEHETRQ